MATARNQGGFSLIEVLAAVAVLAFVYIALAEYAMRGLWAEGEAARRLHASTIADAELAELETQVLLKQPLEIGTQESDEDDYHITVNVSAFASNIPEWVPKTDSGSPATTSTLDGPSLLRSEDTAAAEAPPLRKIVVRVEWPEGRATQSVSRTTIFFDKVVSEDLITELPVHLASANPDASSDETPGDDIEDETDPESDEELEQE